jgi:hypothetical protein
MMHHHKLTRLATTEKSLTIGDLIDYMASLGNKINIGQGGTHIVENVA